MTRDDGRPKKRNTGLVVGLVIGGAALTILAIVGVVVGLLYFGGGAAKKAEAVRQAAGAKVPTRDEFRAKIMGKGPDEVIAAVGRPKTTSEDGDGGQTWLYKDAARDPVTGNIDELIIVTFEKGKVARVEF